MRRLPFPGVFKPHSDSLMLAARMRLELQLSGGSVLDLCTGSGLLAIEAARHGAREVTAVDVSRRAILATRLNARLNGVRVRALRGDLFSPVGGRRYDLIVSNPPYLPSIENQLPRRGSARAWEGGPDGRWFLDRICAEAESHMDERGALLLVHSSLCGEQATVEALARRGLSVDVVGRRRGPLGQRGRARADALRTRGLLHEGDAEEIVIVRAARR